MESERVKASCKMLMKLTPEGNPIKNLVLIEKSKNYPSYKIIAHSLISEL